MRSNHSIFNHGFSLWWLFTLYTLVPFVHGRLVDRNWWNRALVRGRQDDQDFAAFGHERRVLLRELLSAEAQADSGWMRDDGGCVMTEAATAANYCYHWNDLLPGLYCTASPVWNNAPENFINHANRSQALTPCARDQLRLRLLACARKRRTYDRKRWTRLARATLSCLTAHNDAQTRRARLDHRLNFVKTVLRRRRRQNFELRSVRRTEHAPPEKKFFPPFRKCGYRVLVVERVCELDA